MTAQTIPARRLPLLWIETENNCPAASGHRGQRWGKVKGRRFCAVLSRFPTDNGKPSNLFTPLIVIGGFQMTEARVGYHKEVKTASFQGKSITVENLTPMLSPKARDKRKREIESCLYCPMSVQPLPAFTVTQLSFNCGKFATNKMQFLLSIADNLSPSTVQTPTATPAARACPVRIPAATASSPTSASSTKSATSSL